MEEIEWSEFDRDPEMYVTCRCDAVFRSHVRLMKFADGFRHYSRKPCPNCGKHDNATRSSTSEWEKEVIS